MFCACVLACHLQNGSNLQNSALEYNEGEVVIKIMKTQVFYVPHSLSTGNWTRSFVPLSMIKPNLASIYNKQLKPIPHNQNILLLLNFLKNCYYELRHPK